MTETERLTISGKEVILYRDVETNLYRFSKEAVDMLLEALEERDKYRAIGTIKEIKSEHKELIELSRRYLKDTNELIKYQSIGTIEELQKIRNKAIDEFAEKLKKKVFVGYVTIEKIDEIAEQMRGGAK